MMVGHNECPVEPSEVKGDQPAIMVDDSGSDEELVVMIRVAISRKLQKEYPMGG